MLTLRLQRPLLRVSFFRHAMIAICAAATSLPVYADHSVESGSSIDQVLRQAVDEKNVPGVVAMVAVADRVFYQGAAGKRDTTKNLPMTVDSIFRIASMTKPITSVAVMQLVEQGRVKLDEPAATYLAELAQIQVLEDFDANTGKARLRPPKTPPTVRQLLTHTSGFAYQPFDAKLQSYAASGAIPAMRPGDDGYLKAPLMFDPGSKWEYGISTDWLGKLVEKVSGQTLEDYFREHIFQPLGMGDTFFNVPPEKQARVVAIHQHREDGSFVQPPPQPFDLVRFFSGGGGLFSTASDYLKFERMLLNGGKAGSKRVLRSETIDQMARNQIGVLSVVELHSLIPQLAKDPLRVPGSPNKFGLGFGINSNTLEGRRASGSLTWAGIFNTFFWIDPPKKICAVIMMQTLPFSDEVANAVVDQFERAVYANAVSSGPLVAAPPQ